MVYFVGAGTGAADLITVRGMRLLERADVIIYAGSLVNPELLDYAGADCEIHNSAELTLNEIIEIMKRAESEGKMLVRLHTGDPSIYGAVREQMDELDRLGIKYESCPGVSACFGAAASLNLEFTLPDVSQSLIITRMEGKTSVPPKESIESFAAHQASMAIYLSAGMLEELSRRLILGGYKKDTPAVIAYKVTWADEKIYPCSVATLYETARKHGITKTALILVGYALTHKKYEKSKLYSPDFSTQFRQAANGGSQEGAPAFSGSQEGALAMHNSDSVRMAVRRQATFGGSLGIISFTEKGVYLSKRIAEKIKAVLYTKCSHVKELPDVIPVQERVGEWAGEQLKTGNALLFIGASGIAVRAIAPHITDKLHDSPVLTMDEAGKYVIPILSGHIGGANELAHEISKISGALPVITTATDINGKFAVDIFAKRNGLYIANPNGIAKISSKVLAGEEISISIETGHLFDEEIPQGIRLVSYPPKDGVDILVSSDYSCECSLYLKPREYIIGMGCKKGSPTENTETFIETKLSENGISPEQIFALASIELKKDEPCFTLWCKKRGIPFLTFSAKKLQEIDGDFKGSDFVLEKTGTDNVCERAALLACAGDGELILQKCAGDGLTIALARRNWRVSFYE